jgi:hypothetical protein
MGARLSLVRTSVPSEDTIMPMSTYGKDLAPLLRGDNQRYRQELVMPLGSCARRSRTEALILRPPLYAREFSLHLRIGQKLGARARPDHRLFLQHLMPVGRPAMPARRLRTLVDQDEPKARRIEWTLTLMGRPQM